MQWLGRNPVVLAILALLIVYLIVRAGFAVLRMLGSEVVKEEPGETRSVEEFDLRYRCIVCGTEVQLTRVAADDDELKAPRHCREDMALVVEAE